MATPEMHSAFRCCIPIARFSSWVSRGVLWPAELPWGCKQALAMLSTQESFSVTIWRVFLPILKAVLENHLIKSGYILHCCLLSPSSVGGRFYPGLGRVSPAQAA